MASERIHLSVDEAREHAERALRGIAMTMMKRGLSPTT